MWKEVRFSDLMSEPLRNGVYKPKEFHGRGLKIVNMGELFAHDFIGDQEMRRLELTNRERDKSLLRVGDLLYARRSLVLEGAGHCSLVTALPEPTTFESSLIRVRLDERIALPRFYYYFFRSPQGRSKLASIASRTAVSGITGGDLAALQVPLAPLAEQCRIASILADYDDLIENCQRRIRFLEDMARGLYREWFVNFRFPGAEAVPLVDSELGRIPDGWRVCRIADVVAVNRKQINPKSAPGEIRYIDIASVSPGRIDQVAQIAFKDAPGRARRVVSHGDVLWSCVRPNRRSYALVVDPLPNTIASTGFAVLTAALIPFTYLYHATTTDDFVSYLTNHATGAAYPAVTATTFEDARLLLPQAQIVERFHDLVEPMVTNVQVLAKKMENLRRTRDLLLPRLVSGQLTVRTVDAPGQQQGDAVDEPRSSMAVPT